MGVLQVGGARGCGVDAGRPLPITNSNETALVLRSVMSSVQRLVDQNRRCRLENVRACPLPSPGTRQHKSSQQHLAQGLWREAVGERGPRDGFEHRCEMGLISPV